MTRMRVCPGRQVVTAAGHHFGGQQVDVDQAVAAELAKVGAAVPLHRERGQEPEAEDGRNGVRARVRAELQADDDRSDRAIAKLVGCDHKTVSAVRRTIEPEPPAEPEPGVAQPETSDPKPDWIAYAVRLGKGTRDELSVFTKVDLIEMTA